jgi:hypothetical protein
MKDCTIVHRLVRIGAHDPVESTPHDQSKVTDRVDPYAHDCCKDAL